MNIRRKIYLGLGGAIGLLCLSARANVAWAADPDAFIVEVIPSSFQVNEAVDITIKAVKANGDVVKDYMGDVFIEIEGIVDTADYTVPSDGFYSFKAEDQGSRTFSKGLSVKKSGTFSVKISDIIQDYIIGQRTIIVGSTNTNTDTNTINLVSPIAGGIEKNNIANVMASASSLPNAPYQIYVNNVSVAQGMTTANGDISAYVSGIQEGENTLQIKIINANNEIIGESSMITFKYEPIKDGVFNGITIEPKTKVKQGEKIKFTVKTSESVTSVQLKISDGKNIPMDKQSEGTFTKEILMDNKGTFDIDTTLIVLGQNKIYTGIAKIVVEEGVGIGKIRMYADSIDKSKMNITWEVIGNAPQYKINYGKNKTNLDQTATVQTKEIIIENLSVGETYYIQIMPLDSMGTPMGTPSEITEIVVGEDNTCVVVGITISTGQIGEKFYLMRSGVQNVEKYIIYRSEFASTESSQMQKIGETTDTMFEYPFNPNTKQYKYAYYLVEAICKDGSAIRIDNVKKVVVGPAENIMLIVFITLFVYVTYRLYNYSKN